MTKVGLLSNKKIHFNFLLDYFKIGALSGLESFVRNIFYMFMIVRMINVVNEQGLYWVANGFIWSFILIPINELGELIKQDISTKYASKSMNKNKFNEFQKSILSYFKFTIFICLIWFILIPLYKPFMQYILAYNDVDKLFNLVMILIGFYVLYAFQNIFDSVFYAFGKTNYMLLESVATNIIYYGIAFVLYIKGLFIPTLNGIALLFGFGILFDSIVSFVMYIIFIKKHRG